MRLASLLIALLLAVSSPAAADEPADAAAYNDAWQAFLDAKRSGASESQLSTAKYALDLGTRMFGNNDERIPALMSNYGSILFESKQLESAQTVLADALELAEDIHGKKSERIIPYLEKLANVSAERHSDQRQRALYRRAEKIASKQYGKDSLAYGDLLYRAGVSIFALGRSTDGRRYLQDAAEIFANNPAAGTERNAMTAFWRGKIELSAGRDKKATEYLLHALDGFESAGEPMLEYELMTHGHLVHTYESQDMSAAATEHCLAIGKQRGNRVDAEYEPVFRMAPNYPSQMLLDREQGYVDLAFTIDESGFVRDPVVLKREGGKPFEEAAIAAVERFRYAPQFANGEPVAVADVKTRITFKIVR